MHLTLKFLGEIEETMIPPISEAISRTCAGREPFMLHLAGVGVFPGAKCPRILWAGVAQGEEQLRSIFSRLDPLLERIGFPQEKRVFHPHVTLGRIKALHDRRRFVAHAAENREVDVGSMMVEAVHLTESRLRSEGAEYRIRFTSSLKILR